jgi:hypothetical protein
MAGEVPPSAASTALVAAKEGDESAVPEQRPAVLVHCAAGANRSATVVLSYLMRDLGLSLREAFARLYAARPIIGPHRTLCQRLLELERALLGRHTNSISLWEMEPTLREATERIAFVVGRAPPASVPVPPTDRR